MGPPPDVSSFLEYFAGLPDPRKREVGHPLETILVTALCGVIAGADGPTNIEEWATANERFLATLVDLPNGVPSHDTIGRVLGMLRPAALEAAFAAWMKSVQTAVDGEVVAIDGKTLRRARDCNPGAAFVHMVSAWATSNGAVLGQVRTDEKSNEIEAIPRLLQLLSLKGCIVTIDAMGCQKSIVEDIRREGGDYVIAVKENQPTLVAEVTEAFSRAENSKRVPAGWSHAKTKDKGHGREEIRNCWVMPVPKEFAVREQWPSVASLIHVRSERRLAGTIALADRWYISSIDGLTADRALRAIRSHWKIENQLHWTLDVVFGEDHSRMRAEHAAENFVVLRHIALNLLRNAQGMKRSIKGRRLLAGWSTRALAQVLGLPTSTPTP